mmetsp:Transcript_5667/g.9327  ORF Transcript_5667/g.9327 Transcript_5667/m.9327 type:complete len:129 (-) Transcript_5667:28-414(-)
MVAVVVVAATGTEVAVETTILTMDLEEAEEEGATTEIAITTEAVTEIVIETEEEVDGIVENGDVETVAIEMGTVGTIVAETIEDREEEEEEEVGGIGEATVEESEVGIVEDMVVVGSLTFNCLTQIDC